MPGLDDRALTRLVQACRTAAQARPLRPAQTRGMVQIIRFPAAARPQVRLTSGRPPACDKCQCISRASRDEVVIQPAGFSSTSSPRYDVAAGHLLGRAGGVEMRPCASAASVRAVTAPFLLPTAALTACSRKFSWCGSTNPGGITCAFSLNGSGAAAPAHQQPASTAVVNDCSLKSLKESRQSGRPQTWSCRARAARRTASSLNAALVTVECRWSALLPGLPSQR